MTETEWLALPREARRVTPSGRRYVSRDGVRFSRVDLVEDCPEDYWEGPTCSLCDAVGHGYPGGGPCPLEERGWMDRD